MIIQGLKTHDGKFIFSRALHDYRSHNGYMTDGGQSDYFRYGTPSSSNDVCIKYVNFPELNTAKLLEDFNEGENNYGIHEWEDVAANEATYADLIREQNDIEYQLANEHWGTYGKDGKQPLRYVPIKDLEADHIQAILDTQDQINSKFRNLLKAALIRKVQN
jgi:hypothetical protein